MLAKPLTTYESWNLVPPDIPSRSRLYHLEPIGIGSPYVESLTGYISRLADAHTVYPSTLLSRELAKTPRQPAYKSGLDRSSALNGLINMAANWVSALESLTLCNDLRFLTMLTWAEVLPAVGLTRKWKAWCPACFEERRMTGQPLYDPLLWTLQVVKVCPYHRQYLQLECPHCQQDVIPTLAWRSRPGHCPKCEQWLGAPINPALDDVTPESEFEQQLWVAETIGDLLAAAPSLPSPPKKENITRALSACADEVTGGNRAALARALGVPKNTMHLWCKGRALPQIDAYLRICHRLGWKLSTLLAGTFPISEAAGIKYSWPPTKRQPRPRGKTFNQEQILHSLNAALSGNEVTPPPLAEIARRLGYDPCFLRRHFPDLCQRISARYAKYKNQQGKLRIERLCAEIRQATLELYAQGVNPTPRNVRLRLSKPGSFLEKAAQTAYKNALQELGLIDCEFQP
jgi:DNA-binding XRE family transcriptional regulator